MINIFTKKQFLKDLLEDFVDIHNHILPGIDDGSASLAESIMLIKNMKNLGITQFIATPHIMADFYPNNETEAIFYIEVNFETSEVTFQHKNHVNYDGKSVLLLAAETAKVIRQIKEVLETDAWAKYYDITNIDTLRRYIIHQLCFSSLSLSEIKRNLLAHSHGK